MDFAPGIQSVLNSQTPHADIIATFSWILFYGGAAVLAIVLLLTALALWAPTRCRKLLGGSHFVIYGGIVFPAAVLVSLFVYSLNITRSAATDRGPADLRIEIVAQQWWWRVHYLDAAGEVDIVTANEIRIPATARVELILKTADVIHSFWVPNLAGKLDMIPGHVNRLRVTASSEGVFRGQCAEYCGGPHAQMALYVIAQRPADFERWRESQRSPAAEPPSEIAIRGRGLFLQRCSVCHTVRGTTAEGKLGPDLTHVASRTSLAAGILQNNRANIAAWINSSQQIKPGNLMPSMNMFSGEELSALTAYVASLD
jgi:cytochrome c oxidase subunit 2